MAEPTIRTVLFGTDFSDYSRRARDYCVVLARALGASVRVFHVIEEIQHLDPGDDELARWYADLEAAVQRRMAAEVEPFRQAEIPVTAEIRRGVAWKTLVEAAVEEAVDLVVVGSHGIRTPHGTVALGTTSHKVALVCPVPTLVVRSPES